MKHTKEPWTLTDGGTFVEVIAGEKTVLPAIRKSEAGEDFRRIVACVNACTGLPNDALDGGWTAAGLSAYAKQLEQQRGELVAALKEAAKIVNDVTDYGEFSTLQGEWRDLIAKVGAGEAAFYIHEAPIGEGGGIAPSDGTTAPEGHNA